MFIPWNWTFKHRNEIRLHKTPDGYTLRQFRWHLWKPVLVYFCYTGGLCTQYHSGWARIQQERKIISHLQIWWVTRLYWTIAHCIKRNVLSLFVTIFAQRDWNEYIMEMSLLSAVLSARIFHFRNYWMDFNQISAEFNFDSLFPFSSHFTN